VWKLVLDDEGQACLDAFEGLVRLSYFSNTAARRDGIATTMIR
jgi:hypothetical protein